MTPCQYFTRTCCLHIQGRGNITLKVEETDSFKKISILLCGITSKSFMVTSMGRWNLMVSRLSPNNWQGLIHANSSVPWPKCHDCSSVLVKWAVLYPAVLSLWLNFDSMDFILCVFIFINSFLHIIVCGLGSWVGFVGIIFSSFFFCLNFR